MKIAICDDEKPFLDKLYQILQEIRMELNIPISIIKFIDGKELLNYFEVHKDIDVFILDILMNPINGYDVARTGWFAPSPTSRWRSKSSARATGTS